MQCALPIDRDQKTSKMLRKLVRFASCCDKRRQGRLWGTQGCSCPIAALLDFFVALLLVIFQVANHYPYDYPPYCDLKLNSGSPNSQTSSLCGVPMLPMSMRY